MTEAQLQHKIFMYFGQKYPEHNKCFIEINNDTYSRNHAMKRKSMGMQSGASDVLIINPSGARCLFLELKAPDTKHATKSIKRQLAFGEKMRISGHIFILSCSFEFIIKVIDAFIEWEDILFDLEAENGRYIDSEIKTQFHKKTVTFV